MLNLISILCIMVSFTSFFCKKSFTKWNYYLPDELAIKTSVRIPLHECVAECGKRESCEYVGYMRYMHVCKLYPRSNTFSRIESRNYIVIRKEDIDNAMIASDCSCDENQVCDIGTCSYQECLHLSVNNGRVVGNVNDVGSKLIFYCDTNYEEASNISSIHCESNGNWSHTPTCISTIACNDITIINGDLIGTGNGVGAKRTVFCQTGYVEQTNVNTITCEQSGTWSYTPVCITIACSNFTITNGYLTGTGYAFGASRATFCNIGYKEASGVATISCGSQGTWSYIPECTLNTVCPSSNGYSRNGFNVNIVTMDVSRNVAVSKCSIAGGKLVKIDEGWKMEFINELLTACSAYSNFMDYWTDGRAMNGKYRFAENTLVPMEEHVFWFKNKPDGYQSDDCARLTKENGVYLFDDRDCSKSMKYICEF